MKSNTSFKSEQPPNSPIVLNVRLHYVLQKMPKVNCKRWGKVPPRRSCWGGWNESTAAEDGATASLVGQWFFCLEFLINLSMAQWAGRLIMLQNILKYVCISLYMIYLYIIHLFLFPLMIVSLQFQSKIQWFHDHSHHVGLEAKRQLAEAQEQMVSERQSKEALQALRACGRCG